MARRRNIVALAALACLCAAAAALLVARTGSSPHRTSHGLLPFVADATVLANCHRADATCIAQAAGNVAAHDGPRPAFALLRSAVERHLVGVDRCHFVAHVVGFGSLQHFHGRLQPALAQGDAMCQSGYYHGVLQAAIAADPAGGAAADLAHACDTAPAAIASDCAHGLGHGAMALEHGAVAASLHHCDALRSNVGACRSGVFMEAFQPLSQLGHPVAHPERVCAPIHEVSALRECFGRVPVTLELQGLTDAQVLRACARYGAQAQACATAFGRRMAARVGDRGTITRRAHAACAGATTAAIGAACQAGVASWRG